MTLVILIMIHTGNKISLHFFFPSLKTLSLPLIIPIPSPLVYLHTNRKTDPMSRQSMKEKTLSERMTGAGELREERKRRKKEEVRNVPKRHENTNRSCFDRP
jgi:hypothetical protein